MKDQKLLHALNFIDDKYIKEAEPKMKTSTISTKKIIGSVACFVIVIALSLYLFIPFRTGPDVRKYKNSEYYPLIASIADYRYKPSRYTNNFEIFTNYISNIGGLFASKDTSAGMKDNLIAGDNNVDFAPVAPDNSSGNNTSSVPTAPEETDKEVGDDIYVESTDNQVDGVIEADIVKRTTTHIFRLGNGGNLRVYTIDKEESEAITTFAIPSFEDEKTSNLYSWEMYLSEDGKDLTLIKSYSDNNYNRKVGILSLDVSDPTDVKVKNKVSIDGSYNSSRMVNGQLLLVNEYSVKVSEIDYSKPETYVPSITKNGVTECVKFKDIIYPEKLTNLHYSVVTLLDEGSLDLLGASALLCFNGQIYVSNENIYVTRGYIVTSDTKNSDNSYTTVQKSDIAVLRYADGTIENKGIITIDGTVKDQYSMDEYEGHFRVVTTTSTVSGAARKTNACLGVFNLETLTKIAEVRDFAPDGEEVASVRFDGDKAYVCTAVIVTFTDPVYYFDLSDYSNITYTDTGVIDGFSSSLIQLGDGYLLGIGRENSRLNKVEVYEEVDGQVISVDKYLFEGDYSTEYKSYFIDRENDVFGFAVEYMFNEDKGLWYNSYVLLIFDGYELAEVVRVEMNITSASRTRAFIDDGYLYVTDDRTIYVVYVGL